MGLFPAAFVLIPAVPFPFFAMVCCCFGFSSIVGTELCEPSYLDPNDESPSLGPTSEAPAEGCELDLRTIPGRLLDVVDTMNAVAFFLGLVDRPFDFSSLAVGGPRSLAVLTVMVSSSIPGSGGDTNRAVGRGPEAEVPLGLFKIGRGALAEGVIDLEVIFDTEAEEVG